jgi:signal transduction histidine kinase
VRFEISDTGPGVPPHLAEQIFEPFFTTRPVGSGTGLGLSICRSIIQDAQGDIGVLAAPEGGALFWFELPAFQSESSDAQSLDRSVTQH